MPTDMSSSLPAAFRRRRAQKGRGRCAGGRSGNAHQGGDSGRVLPAYALQALLHRDPVVGVKLHHVGDRAKRDQIEQRAEIGPALAFERATLAQLGAQRQHQIEHDTDAGQILARKAAARLIRVNDAPGIRERGARQMMIGNERACRAGWRWQRLRCCDSIVDGNQQVRIFDGFGKLDDLWRQAVAKFETVWRR